MERVVNYEIVWVGWEDIVKFNLKKKKEQWNTVNLCLIWMDCLH